MAKRRIALNTSLFIKLYSAANNGGLMLTALLLALCLSNSSFAATYNGLLHHPLMVLPGIDFNLCFAELVNELMMAFFFFVVTIEIKKEIKFGYLSQPAQRAMPVLGALGGMAAPIAIYYLYNRHDPNLLSGWAIPCATDIAFTISIMSFLGSAIPPAVKVLVSALAIIDDLLSIILIALFYTDHIDYRYLPLILVVLIAMIALNRSNIRHLLPYCLGSTILWYCFLRGGIQPTLAGVIAAAVTPMVYRNDLDNVLRRLTPIISLMILPLFALVNCAINLQSFSLSMIVNNTVSQGTFMGLFFGKQIGIFLSLFCGIKLRYFRMPQDSCWSQLYIAALLCGIGFTMSLYISLLSFTDSSTQTTQLANMGVILGSAASALTAIVVNKVRLLLADHKRSAKM